MQPKRIVITGGTGSLGQVLVRKLLSLDTTQTITVLSRDELKQYEMQRQLKGDPRVEFALGDVRNASRLSEVFASHDCVIHTAALKQVVMGEHNPMEYIMTNILGTANVVEAAISQGVERAIVISTDKAASPVNLYGGTKFVADKYVTRTATDSRKVRESGLKLSVVRFGNFLNSRGSVLPIWREMHAAGLPIPANSRSTRQLPEPCKQVRQKKPERATEQPSCRPPAAATHESARTCGQHPLRPRSAGASYAREGARHGAGGQFASG